MFIFRSTDHQSAYSVHRAPRNLKIPGLSYAFSRLLSVKFLRQCDGSIFYFFFSELCLGKAMVAYTKPQQWKKEESERLRGERDQIKFIDIGFERWKVVRFRNNFLDIGFGGWQVVRFRKARGRQDVPQVACSRDLYLFLNNDFSHNYPPNFNYGSIRVKRWLLVVSQLNAQNQLIAQ